MSAFGGESDRSATRPSDPGFEAALFALILTPSAAGGDLQTEVSVAFMDSSNNTDFA